MSVHQVEEYYVWLPKLSISEETENKLKEYLSDEGWSEYELETDEDGKTLTVDAISSESEAETLEEELKQIIEGGA